MIWRLEAGGWKLVHRRVDLLIEPQPLQRSIRERSRCRRAVSTSSALSPAIAMDLGMLVNFGDARERYLEEYEELLGGCDFAVHEAIGLPSGLLFSIADRESPERACSRGPFELSGAGTDAPVEMRFGPEVRCQPRSAATVSRHASAQAASSTLTPDARLPVHAAQMSIDSTSILRSRTSGSGISACAAPSTA